MDAAHAMVLPLVLHIGLTVIVGINSLKQRIAAIRQQRTTLTKIALDNANWPDDVRKFGNNFDNQFQLPMMAYSGVALIIATGLADWIFAGLMWIFIAARVGHSLVHTGSNNVVRRMQFFLVSFAAVVLLWAWFAIRYFAIG